LEAETKAAEPMPEVPAQTTAETAVVEAPVSNAKEAQVKTAVESTNEQVAEKPKPVTEMTDAEKLKHRADKFGITSEELKKAARAERFGVVLSSTTPGSAAGIKSTDVSVDSDTLKRRAERFGQVTNSKLAKIEDDGKKSERAKRFGVPAIDSTSEAAAKEARAERFKGALGNPDDEMKKKRAERFGIISAA